MTRRLKGTLIGAGAFAVVAAGVLSLVAGPSPRDWWGMLRWALPRMHSGDLKVGDQAPDAMLVALDGQQRFPLRSKLSARPLVLIFGSFT